MSEYTQMADTFLANAHAKMDIRFIGRAVNTEHDCGSFDDFCAEYGYSNDSIRALKTYLACGDEYSNLRRIFTSEQIEELRSIE